TALQSYTLNENSTVLINATNHVYMSLGNLLKLCDEVLLTADNENCPSLSKENVKEIVELMDKAVNNLVNLANEKISEKAAGGSNSSNTLQRPAVDIASQRTSLPDIPLTPRERDILEQTSMKTVRASHSTESILRDSSPPPKPPLPDRGQDPPPLPPKRKSQHSKNHSFHETSDCNSDSTFLGCGALDRMSLRSRSPEDNSSLLSASAGSLDSALNHSREEEELRALTQDKSSLLAGSQIGSVAISSGVWDESDCPGMLLQSGGGPILTDSSMIDRLMNNRNSNESGFESMYSLRISRDHQQSSSTSFKSAAFASNNSQIHHIHQQQQHHQQQQQQHQKIDTFVTQASGDSAGEVVSTTTTTEVTTSSSRIQSASLSKTIQYGSIEANDEVFGGSGEIGGGSDKPPALPIKTRQHSIRRERHPSQYDNVDDAELERSSHDTFNSSSLHQIGGSFHHTSSSSSSSRAQMIGNLPSKHISLIEPRHMNHFSEEPPPLPMKKKHRKIHEIAAEICFENSSRCSCEHSSRNFRIFSDFLRILMAYLLENITSFSPEIVPEVTSEIHPKFPAGILHPQEIFIILFRNLFSQKIILQAFLGNFPLILQEVLPLEMNLDVSRRILFEERKFLQQFFRRLFMQFRRDFFLDFPLESPQKVVSEIHLEVSLEIPGVSSGNFSRSSDENFSMISTENCYRSSAGNSESILRKFH
ncbi:hypothetical protein RP20_CCG022518, partial [Aedes albopictus]